MKRICSHLAHRQNVCVNTFRYIQWNFFTWGVERKGRDGFHQTNILSCYSFQLIKVVVCVHDRFIMELTYGFSSTKSQRETEMTNRTCKIIISYRKNILFLKKWIAKAKIGLSVININDGWKDYYFSGGLYERGLYLQEQRSNNLRRQKFCIKLKSIPLTLFISFVFGIGYRNRWIVCRVYRFFFFSLSLFSSFPTFGLCSTSYSLIPRLIRAHYIYDCNSSIWFWYLVNLFV